MRNETAGASSFKAPLILLVLFLIAALLYYAVEPWAVTFVDDGPYYSALFSDPFSDLPIQSQVELCRLGRLIYTLESRPLPGQDQSVLVLRNAEGSVLWARVPLKPDGELGLVELRRASVTWYGGWRVAIAPANQETGNLYLGIFGGFRFFNHSW